MSIDIVFFNNGPYYPGQTIDGKVVCVFSSSSTVRGKLWGASIYFFNNSFLFIGIRLKLRGREFTSWEEEVSYTDDRTNETKYTNEIHTGDNNFIEFEETLAGQGEGFLVLVELHFTFFDKLILIFL